MTRPLDPRVAAKLAAAAQRRLSAADVDAYQRTPISDEEREEVLAQLRWFRGRYPTGAERLA